MLKIQRVGIVGDDMMDVQLENGNIVMLELAPLLDRQEFKPLAEDDRIRYPKTDGETVYWRDGPRLTVDELFALMRFDGSKGKNIGKTDETGTDDSGKLNATHDNTRNETSKGR